MDECGNRTIEKEFHISTFSSSKAEQLVLFTGVLLMYMLSVLGNIIIIALVRLVPQLHTPMYFFLSNLSIVDITYVSSILPKLLFITLTNDNRISFHNCIAQQFFFLFCADTEVWVLTSMAYDRYVAICSPLHYSLIMNKNICIAMAASFWIYGCINSMIHAVLTSLLSFCYSTEVNNFFCDLKTLVMLSSSDTRSREIFILVEDVFLAFLPFALTVTSYVFIISTILKIRSSEGRLKAFSSCTSHLTTVFLFYGPCLYLYVKPESRKEDKLLSMMYVALVPMLNPLVYSLRNKEVWGALRKVTNCKINML
ncbi:olfactory receptor 5V1-like [Rhinophrynus dorsalis]